MRKLRLTIGLGLVAAATLPVFCLGAERIPLELFAQEPATSQPALSPDGKSVVYVKQSQRGPVVSLLDIATGAARTVLPGRVKNFDVQWCKFKNDERLLCGFRGVDYRDGQPFWITRLVAVDVKTGQNKVLIQNGIGNGTQNQDRVFHWLPRELRKVLIEVDDDGNIFPNVYELDVYTGKTHRIVAERDRIVSWVADRDGVVRFGFGYREGKGIYIVRDGPDSPWHELLRFKLFERDHFEVLGFGAAPNSLLVKRSHNGRDAIFDMDLTEKSDFQLLFSDPRFDVGDAIVWPADESIVGFELETEKPEQHYIDSEIAQLQASINAALPKTRNVIDDASRDGQQVLVRASSDVQPDSYYLLERSKSVLSRIGGRNDALAKLPLAAMKPIIIEATNKLQLPGYLTLPAGSDGRDLPTIIYPHGGPYYRDSWGYDDVVQVLASRGYAVVQVNFRGSTGYGDDWFDAGYQGWGTVMHDDITAAAKWAIAQGIANPQRMCIVGWSYGGYAALIGAVKEPQLYKCAVSIAGVSNILDLQFAGSRFYGGREAVRAATGLQDLRENSPNKHADKIQIPILMVHGTADIQVPVEQSKSMARALDRNNKKYELELIKDGDHSLMHGEWRLRLYKHLTEFLDRNIGSAALHSP